MARASVKRLTTKTKAKTRPRMSKTVAKTVDAAAYGSEPVDITGLYLANVFNWYNYMYEDDDTRSWLFEYMKNAHYSKADIAAVKRCPKIRITRTNCTVARIINNGNQLPDDMVGRLNEQIATLIELGTKIREPDDEVHKPEISIQERVQIKIKQTITDCEEAIDNDPTFNVYDWLMGMDLSPTVAMGVRDYYADWVDDFRVDDPLATRAEKKYNDQQAKRWQSFVDDIERFINNKKVVKTRKPKAKKVKAAVDVVKTLKFQKEYPPLKIVSINPADILGAKQLWTYNTKTRKLTKFEAIGPAGIQVKGTSVIGFDVEKSLTKSIRKPELVVSSVLTAGKVALRRLIEEIKTNQTSPTGRINTDTILLRVIK